jgi:hypothetical protein
MSAIGRQPPETGAPELVVRARGASRRLRFRWSISPVAAAEAGLCPPGTRAVALELELKIVRSRGTARAAPASAEIVRDGHGSPIGLPPATGAAITDPETGVMHVDIDGFIHATLRGRCEVLYARTPLLARLGLPGGRYECEGLASRG